MCAAGTSPKIGSGSGGGEATIDIRASRHESDGSVRSLYQPKTATDDLGIGLSTLVRWIGRSRDRLIDEPPKAGSEDVAAELKRLRRENEILRQERDILKRATAFFAREGSR